MAAKATERAQIIGHRVRLARDEARLNNSSLAVATGLPRRTIVRIANGHNEADIATLERIAAATNKTLDYFRVDSPGPSDRVRAAAEDLVTALVDELRAELLGATAAAEVEA